MSARGRRSFMTAPRNGLHRMRLRGLGCNQGAVLPKSSGSDILQWPSADGGVGKVTLALRASVKYLVGVTNF